jgi:transposase-like protein
LAEAAEFIGATRYERSESRTNERNGSRPRMLATKAGDIDLRIPKLRKGSFFPLILEPRRRIDQALYAVVMEAYVTIFVQPDPATVAASWDEVRGQLAGRFPKIGTLMDNAKTEVLTFTAFPVRTGPNLEHQPAGAS